MIEPYLVANVKDRFSHAFWSNVIFTDLRWTGRCDVENDNERKQSSKGDKISGGSWIEPYLVANAKDTFSHALWSNVIFTDLRWTSRCDVENDDERKQSSKGDKISGGINSYVQYYIDD